MDFKKRPYKRNDRLSKEIKIILSDFILKDFNLDGSGIITISKVDISRDLRLITLTDKRFLANDSFPEPAFM